MIKTRFIQLSLVIVFAIAVVGQSQAAPDNLLNDMGITFEAGLNPRCSVGYIMAMRNIFIDANSAYDSSISGTGLDTFTSVGSQIYRVSLGYKVPLQKQAVGSIRTLDRGISLFGSVGIYWQSLEAEVKPNLVQYSTYGNTISKKFLKPFFSIGGMYRLSKMFAFIGRVLYYQSAEETFWLQTEGVSGIGNGIGTGNTIKIKSINGIGLSIGFILNYP